MYTSCAEMPKACFKSIPSELHDVLRLMTNANLQKGMADNVAKAMAWASVSKMTGLYSSVKPDKTTAARLSDYISRMGVPNPVPQDKLHVTIVSSEKPLIGYEPRNEMTFVKAQVLNWDNKLVNNYRLILIGDKDQGLAIKFDSQELSSQVWKAFDLGMDYDKYPMESISHITLSYDVGDYDLSKLVLPDFDMNFLEEKLEPYQKNWAGKNGMAKRDVEFEAFTKVDEDQRLVYGWANVTSIGGEPVWDLQGDCIDDDDIMKAAHEFMSNSRRGDVMHEIKDVGKVVESVVFTQDLQKSLGIDLGKTGWFVGIKVENDTAWRLVKNGTFTGFSIGGKASKEPVYD